MPRHFQPSSLINKNVTRASVTISFFLFATFGLFIEAQAACGGAQPYVSCGDVQVTMLYIEAGNNAYIKVDGNPESMGCTLNGGFITLPGNAVKFNAVYATLITAQSMGRKVSIRMGTEAQCTVAYVTLSAQ